MTVIHVFAIFYFRDEKNGYELQRNKFLPSRYCRCSQSETMSIPSLFLFRGFALKTRTRFIDNKKTIVPIAYALEGWATNLRYRCLIIFPSLTSQNSTFSNIYLCCISVITGGDVVLPGLY